MILPVDERKAREIKLTGVSKRYGSLLALDGVDLIIERSRIACVVGPSGCGKTTLLNILAGFETEYEGTAQVGGAAVQEPGPDRTVVFQQDALFPWLTVYKNVVAGVSGKELAAGAAARARDLLEMVGLADFVDRYPYQLSGGMRQRTSIARALTREPSVLLMDEPFGALDALTRRDMQGLLQTVCLKYSPTILFITHDVDEALILGDVVYVMAPRPGRILDAIPIEFERPRKASAVTSVAFNRVKERVMVQLGQGR
jgi:NitT/TauT family transport system ATP-binding protein